MNKLNFIFKALLSLLCCLMLCSTALAQKGQVFRLREQMPSGLFTYYITIGLDRTAFERYVAKERARLLLKTDVLRIVQSNKTTVPNFTQMTCNAVELTSGISESGDVSNGVTGPLPNVECDTPYGAAPGASDFPRYNLYSIMVGQTGELTITINGVAADLDPALYIWDGCTANASLEGCVDRGGGLEENEERIISLTPCTEYFLQVKHWRNSNASTQDDCTDCTYSITATTSGICCSPIIITATSLPDTNGSDDGSVSATATGGTSPYDFDWGLIGTGEDIYEIGADTYTVIVTDVNGCTETASVTVANLPCPAMPVTITTTQTLICSDEVAILAASGDYDNYEWNTGDNGPTATTDGGGIYIVEVSDTHGCTNTASINITQAPDPTPTISAAATIICPEARTTLTATGGVSYTWDGGSVGSTLQSIPAGTYTVVASDANGCSASTAITVAAYASPTLTLSAGSNEICLNKFVNLTAPTNGTLRWNTNATTQQITVSPTINTTYIVTATSANNCTAVESTTIIVNPLPIVSADATNATQCIGTNATSLASGATSYLWTNGQLTPTLSTPTAGVYTVIGTDTKGCTNTASVTVVINHATAGLSLSRNAICIGQQDATLTAMGGVTYEWSHNATLTTESDLVAPSVTTIYNVTVTDVNGCHSDKAITLIVNPLPIPVIGPQPAQICFNKYTLLLEASGAGINGIYVWSINANSATTPSVEVTVAGNYSVTITDVNGCVSNSTIEVIPPVDISGVAIFNATIMPTNPLGIAINLTVPTVQPHYWVYGDGTTSNININHDHIYPYLDYFVLQHEVKNDACPFDSDVETVEVHLAGGTVSLPIPFTNLYTANSAMTVLQTMTMKNHKNMVVVQYTDQNAKSATTAIRTALLLINPEGKVLAARKYNVEATEAHISPTRFGGILSLTNEDGVYVTTIDSLTNKRIGIRFTDNAPTHFQQLTDNSYLAFSNNASTGKSYIYKFSSALNLTWAKELTTNVYANNNIKLAAMGVFANNAYFAGTIDNRDNPAGSYRDPILYTLNLTTGAIIESKKFNRAGEDNIFTLVVTETGTIFLGGNSTNGNISQALLIKSSTNPNNPTVARYLENLTNIDATFSNSTGLHIADKTGKFIVLAPDLSLLSAKSLLHNQTDFVATSTTPDGNFLFGGNTSNSIVLTKAGYRWTNCADITENVVITPITFTAFSENSTVTTALVPPRIDYPGSKILLVNQAEFCNTIIANENAVLAESQISFFPNPTQDYLTIQGTAPIRQITVFNIAGQQMLQKTVKNTQITIPTTELLNGIYTILIETAEGKIAKKIVVLRP